MFFFLIELSQKSLKRKANSMQSKIYLDTIELYKKSSICDTGSFILTYTHKYRWLKHVNAKLKKYFK